MRLLLFDIDGTLCKPMDKIEPVMIETLEKVKEHGWDLGVVSGSDRSKAVTQLGEYVLNGLMKYCFHENGCVVFHQGECVAVERLESYFSESTISDLTIFLQELAANSKSPIVAGSFIERRTCMINVAPCGRGCNTAQRKQFHEWDVQNKCREKMAKKIRSAFPHLPVTVAVGGEISLDIFPTGLDKRKCLQYLTGYDEIHFIGDKVKPGGNDHEIYMDPRVHGHETTGPQETIRILERIVLENDGETEL